MLKLTNFIIFFLLLANYAFTQQVKPDTSNLNFKDSEEYNPTDTLNSNIKYMPEDMMFVPSEIIYDYQWNNKDIRFRKLNIDDKKDTTLILFNTSPDNNFYFPVNGKLLSPFGYRGHHFHTGVDIRLCHNDSVYTVMAGKVRIAHRFRGYGNCVVVRHYNGLETVYAHLNKILVNVNDEIKAGDVVGLGGRTGHATADHLHFEVRFLEQPINPLAFLDFDNHKLKSDTLILTANTFTNLSKPPNKPYNRKKGKKGKNLASNNTPNKDTSKTVKSNPVKSGVNRKSKIEDDPTPAKDKSSSVKKYYTVKPGDNLYDIARRNNTTVNKLCQLNGFSKKKVLKVGSKIKLL